MKRRYRRSKIYLPLGIFTLAWNIACISSSYAQEDKLDYIQSLDIIDNVDSSCPYKFNPTKYIEAANHLKKMGKVRSMAMLLLYLDKVGESKKDKEDWIKRKNNVILLSMSLFKPFPNQHALPPPMLNRGNIKYVDKDKIINPSFDFSANSFHCIFPFRRFPLLEIEGVPFLFLIGPLGSGAERGPVQHICLLGQHFIFDSEPYSVPKDPVDIAHRYVESEGFQRFCNTYLRTSNIRYQSKFLEKTLLAQAELAKSAAGPDNSLSGRKAQAEEE